MWKLLKSLLGNKVLPTGMASSLDDVRSSEKYTIRIGEATMTDEVFEAWTSGELGDMLKVIDNKTNLIDRHFLLMGIVDQTYKRRSAPEMRDRCKAVAEMHIQEFSEIAPALKQDLDGVLPRVTTFQQCATLLTEEKEFSKAIQVCEKAIMFGLNDGTKSGYSGRIARIKKKMAKDES